jgi:hypothetical protein
VRGVGARILSLFPRGVFDAAWQFLLFFAAYNGYQVVRGFADGREDLAYANAERIMDVERWLGAFFEPGFQQALLDHERWLVEIANFLYLNSHFVVTLTFLTWLYFCRNDHFYFVRNMFMVGMALALAGYALFPTAPPRLVPEAGFTDTIATFTGVAQDDKTASLLINQYAAVPSMHIAFSLMIAVPAAALSRLAVMRIVWSSYPLLVFFAITATANHYWLDAAAGAAVACLAAVTAHQLARLRPASWTWREAAREAPA